MNIARTALMVMVGVGAWIPVARIIKTPTPKVFLVDMSNRDESNAKYQCFHKHGPFFDTVWIDYYKHDAATGGMLLTGSEFHYSLWPVEVKWHTKPISGVKYENYYKEPKE